MGRVSFGLGAARVDSAGQDMLSRFALSLGGSSAAVRVRVDGYASSDGPEADNFELSCRRALAVREALVRGHGFSASHITTYAHGETTEFGRANLEANRTVVVSAAPLAPGVVPEVAPASPGGNRQQPATGTHSGPHLLMTGLPAATMVERLLRSSHPITVSSSLGWTRLVPGTVWDNDKMLVWPTEMVTYYTEGPNLYEVPTWLFLRTFYLDAMAQGMRRAEHWETIAEVEFALLEGAFVPVWAIIVVSLGGAALTYIHHKKQIDPALRQVPRIIELLSELHHREPALFNLLLRTSFKALLDVITQLPKAIRPQDVAFFLGRLFHTGSLFKSPEQALMWWVPEVTLGALSKVVIKTATLVFLTHSPSIAVSLAEKTMAHEIETWQNAMKEEGISVSEEEARVLFDELRAHPDARHRLLVLDAALREFLPALATLRQALQRR